MGPPYLDKAHLPHGLLVVVVHLADQGVAEVHGDPLDGLVLPGRFQDLQQQLVDPTVLELQLLWNTEVAQSQAAVALDLEEHREEPRAEADLEGRWTTPQQTPSINLQQRLGDAA